MLHKNQELFLSMVSQQHNLMSKGAENWSAMVFGDKAAIRNFPTRSDLDDQILLESEFVDWFKNHVTWAEGWVKRSKELLGQYEEEVG